MPRGGPNPQFSSLRRQAVGKNQRTLLRQPERCFTTAASVVESNEPSRKLAAMIDPLQFRFRDVVAEKEPRAKCAAVVTACEQIYVPNVIRLENNDCVWRTRVQALPNHIRAGGRSQGIENQYFAPRLDACR